MARANAYNPTRSKQNRVVSVSDAVNIPVQRFEESIAGRDYLIEVAAVDPNRWRAYIVKAPGVPTALMPFYGPTAEQAADLLLQWLTRAHARAAASIRPILR